MNKKMKEKMKTCSCGKKYNNKMHDMCDDCLDDAQTGGVYGLIKNPIDKNPNHTTYDCGCFWFRKERCV